MLRSIGIASALERLAEIPPIQTPILSGPATTASCGTLAPRDVQTPGARPGLLAGVALAGPTVALREMRRSDAEAVERYAGDRGVTRYLVWGPNTPAQTLAHLELAIAQAGSPHRTDHHLAVVELESGELVGAAHLSLDSERNRRGDIGYVLRRDRWGRGLATETVHLLLQLGFRWLGLHHIRATCHPDNLASARVLEKVGMGLDGRIRDHMLIRGAWRNSLTYSILAPEWRPPTWLATEPGSNEEIVIRQAANDHVGEIVEILSEAAGWLAGRGIDQWPTPFPDAVVADGVSTGVVYLAYRSVLPVATITLQWSDPAFWPDQGDDDAAAYVHRLAVRRGAAGQGLGHRLLAWADERVAEAGAAGYGSTAWPPIRGCGRGTPTPASPTAVTLRATGGE